LQMQSFDWSGLRWLRRARPEIGHAFLTEADTANASWWDGIDPVAMVGPCRARWSRRVARGGRRITRN